MNLPPINIGNIDIKLAFGGFVLNVLYVKFGYFHTSMREHSHSYGSYELHYIPSGQGILVAEGKRYPLTPGTLFMTGPNVAHEQIPDHSDPMAEYCVFLEVLPGDSQPAASKYSTNKENLLSELLVNTPFWIGLDNENMMALFEMLADELSAKRIGFHHMATNILEMIITRMVRQYTKHSSSLLDVPVKTLDDSRMLTIENCFLNEYHSITLGQLADRLGLSTRQTERTVQKQYGVSFKDKKQQSRMGAAAQLLTTTDMTISAIAAEIGFATLEQFSHSFKQYHGMTATQYRSRRK
ncbi:AraC family transcriptional regulator [Paenibacillus harenae]|uniref:AraC-like DNA-binding protein/quercetin dioxygenase-like cupin family protein n=1 Tax=Paenibacillus harenae TaxID=306543 RepID=A0ABT9U4R1_PAEHA|nr:AraC family transcriptional regulator [Paenibacillus harenae]MDQ0114237.1 AraC-like DNA-binding protein/quercetin dioxygenase-like cupin family protein [Paenibacillus harenae]